MTRILPVIAATLLLALVAASVGAGQDHLHDPRRGLRPRRRDEPVRRDGLRPAGPQRRRDPRPLLLGHRARDDRPEPAGPRPARRRRRRRRGSPARARPARASSTRASTYTLKRRGLSQVDLSASGRRLATFTRAAAGRGRRRRDRAGRPGQLPRRARVRAQRLQRAPGHQLRRPRRLPAGRRARRVARVVAGRGAARRRRSRPARTRSRRPRATTSTTTPTRARRSTRASGSRPPSTNPAVADTRGQIVTYQGQPVVTYFFSTSGGRTESVENTTLGNEPKPWLKSVEDQYDDVSPRHRWTLEARARRRRRRSSAGS